MCWNNQCITIYGGLFSFCKGLFASMESQWSRNLHAHQLVYTCRNPTSKECEDDTHIPEMWTWESSRIPEYLELDCKSEKTSPWGVLYTIGKVLKCKCQKWPCMSHLDIYNTSYGQKSEIDLTAVRVGRVQHTVGKLLTRATSFL
jgi:hypothetical protein